MTNSIERLPYIFTLKHGFSCFVSQINYEYNLVLINRNIILEELSTSKVKTWLIKRCRTDERAKSEFDKYNRWINEVGK